MHISIEILYFNLFFASKKRSYDLFLPKRVIATTLRRLKRFLILCCHGVVFATPKSTDSINWYRLMDVLIAWNNCWLWKSNLKRRKGVASFPEREDDLYVHDGAVIKTTFTLRAQFQVKVRQSIVWCELAEWCILWGQGHVGVEKFTTLMDMIYVCPNRWLIITRLSKS